MVWFKESLVARVATGLLAITLMSILNIAVSMAIGESTRGDATAINQAGALRMQSFRVIADIQQYHQVQTPQNRTRASDSLARLQQRLEGADLADAMPGSPDHPLNLHYLQVREHWREHIYPQMQLALETPGERTDLVPLGEEFVAQLHALVDLLEQRSESKIKLLGIIEGLSLLLIIAVVGITLIDFRHNIIRPLRRLMTLADAARHHDFSGRSHMRGQDELSLLGQTFDTMANDLAASYASLEARAAEKTRELENSHQALQLLHNASSSLYGSDDLCLGSVPLLQKLESLLGIGPVSLYLHDRDGETPFQAVTTYANARPEHCRSFSCNACLTGHKPLEDRPDPESDGRRLLLPVRTGQELVGTLEVWYPDSRGLKEHERQLLETLSDQLATAVSLQRRMTEEQRLTLMEERTVIARELHDSLAQSLSYLKMQVARLQRLQRDQTVDPRQEEVVQELRNGLNNGYRQLRELLTTFRLKFDSPGLQPALVQTAEEFSERLGFPITLEFSLPPQMLSPNEEIHILQIVREALANVVKHAQADSVSIDVRLVQGQVQVRVTDNGVGLPESGIPPSHYGLIIMRDRSTTLGGQLDIRNRPGGGVEVCLSLPTQQPNLITQAS